MASATKLRAIYKNMQQLAATVKIYLLIVSFLLTSQLPGQNELQRRFQEIADSLSGKLGVSALHIETGESVSLNGS